MAPLGAIREKITVLFDIVSFFLHIKPFKIIEKQREKLLKSKIFLNLLKSTNFSLNLQIPDPTPHPGRGIG